MSIRNATAFERPGTIEEAWSLVSDGGVPVSGGTSVILREPPQPVALVDLTGLGLAGIEEDDRGVTVGSTTTLTAMLEHPGLAAMAGGVIAEVLRVVGSPLLRNAASIGGHLARGRLSDIATVLLALDAEIEVYDGAASTMPLEDYYRNEVHRTPALITSVRLPLPSQRSAAAFRKVSRTHFDYALLNAACRVDLDDGAVAEARVVVGETPALAARIAEAEQALLGHPLDADRITAAAAAAVEHVPARSDQRASDDYRRHLTGVLVRDCLDSVVERLP